MTTVWRLVKAGHAPTAFDGEGARKDPGRWNHKGIAVVYVSESKALAALEVFVNTGDEGNHIKYVHIKAEIPDNIKIEIIQEKDLPTDWKKYPAPKSTQDIGTQWVKSGNSAVLRVPSVLVPEEFNYLLNISHPDFKKIKIDDSVPFRFDPRMWKERRGIK